MWLHASDVSYDGAQAPQEKAGARGGSSSRQVSSFTLRARREIAAPSSFLQRDRGGGTKGEEPRLAAEPMRAEGIVAAKQ